jgi:predicted transcriptional regulator
VGVPDPIARAVAQHTRKHGITVTALAARAGIHRANVSSWLHGNRAMSAANVSKLLEAIDRLDGVIREIER